MSVDIGSIKKSYGRCLVSHGGKKKFFDHFYEIFLVSDPEVEKMFSQVDLAKQQVAIKRGISMMIMYAENPDSMAESVLKGIRKSHSTDKLYVTTRHYKIWEDCLVKSLKEFDGEFSDELEANWRNLVQETVNYLLPA